MGIKSANCMSSTTLVRELYWGCGGGVMECFSGAVVSNAPNHQPHPSCSVNAARGFQDSRIKARKSKP